MEESNKRGEEGTEGERREVRPVLELGEFHVNQTLHWTIQNDCA